jgi:hypothetical protein
LGHLATLHHRTVAPALSGSACSKPIGNWKDVMHGRLNILVVNPVHPAGPHVSAIRAWRFAEELSRLHHRVVFVTVPSEAVGKVAEPDIPAHDWSAPLLVEVAREPHHSPPASTLLRKMRTTWRLVLYGGEARDWARNASSAVAELSAAFVPDVVWCTFGQMESVLAARRIARSAGRPWILDLKDNWELYVPRGLRRLMVYRTRGWTAVTCNSQFNACKAKEWQSTAAEVIYSGVDHAFVEMQGEDDGYPGFTINVVGSLYFEAQVDTLLHGVRLMAESLGEQDRGQLRIRYVGGDGRMFARVAARQLGGIAFKQLGYLSIRHMAVHCRSASVNAYIGHSGGFHHKLLELLACRRPILVCPSEGEEARQLAAQAGTRLFQAESASAAAIHLRYIFDQWKIGAPPDCANRDGMCYSWATQARQLERVLLGSVSRWSR